MLGPPMASAPSQKPPSPLALPLAWDLVADAYDADVVPLFEQAAEKALALAEVGTWTHLASEIEADLLARFGPGPVRLEAPAYLGFGRRPASAR